MKLIIAKPSPYARKVRVALLEKAIAYHEVVDNPWDPDAQAARHNPLGKVPVLIDGDGGTYADSRVIVAYLETLGRPPALLPEDPAMRVRALQIEAIADGICDAVVLTVLENARAEALRSADWIARQRAKVEAGVAALDAERGDGAWLVGDAMSIADIAAAAALAYLDLRLPGFDWRRRAPGLVGFAEVMEARPSFQATRPEAQEIKPVN